MAAATHRRVERGFSLVELMVGTAIGLLMTAATSSLVVREVREHRALRLETRLTQDLRHAADIVARDLRRAGHWQAAASAIRLDDSTPPVAPNPYAFDAATDVAGGAVRIAYSRDAAENGSVDSDERFGFRLRNGTVELQLGDAGWQAVTDPATVTVTAFTVTPRVEETSLADFCAEPCAAGSAVCPPRQRVVHLEVDLAGRSVADAAVVRQARSGARLRHAPVIGRCDG